MTKFTFLTLSLIISSPFFAQNLDAFIPNTSQFVLAIDCKKITEKIGKEKIFESDLFNTVTRELILNKNPAVKIGEIGINLDRGMAVFFNITESMEYLGVLYGIENTSTFEAYVRENAVNGTIEEFEDFKILFFANNDELIAWNKDHAVYLKIEYLAENLKPLSSKSDAYWYRQYPELNPNPTTDTYHRGEYGIEEAIELYEQNDETPPVHEDTNAVKDEPFSQEVLARMQVELEIIKADYEKQRLFRNHELKEAYQSELARYFNTTHEQSILSLKNYAVGKDLDADLYCWMQRAAFDFGYGVNDFYYSRRRGYFRDIMLGLNYFIGDEIYANLFLKKDGITVLTDFKYNSKSTAIYEEIYDSKFSRNLLKHVNTEQVLWIASASVNSEKFWQHYPGIYAGLFGNRFDGYGEYTEEIEVLVDFFELILDEKALDELATGDAIFLVKDIVAVNVKYNSYEYNEDYSERTKVEKTRTEMLPRFVGLFTTKNEAFFEKILNLGVKHKLLIRTKNYYQSNPENYDFPIEMGFALKNGIAMISSDVFEVKSFTEGKLKSYLPKAIKSKILSNQSYNRFDVKEMMTGFPYQGYDGKELATYEYIRDNTRTIEFISNFKNNLLETRIDIAIPDNQKNGADYLWNFFHGLDVINKR